ncbi:galactose oxidase [Rheinheimera sp.]|uniref:Kelch repeat-containing protein n=1 Tax=Rheinheimera sp. TaxID=1869214 RepID=UPI00307E3440
MKGCGVVLLLGNSMLAQAELQWQRVADLPVAVQEIYPVVYQGKIVVAGGIASQLPLEQGQMTAAVQLYDAKSNQWSMGPALPEGRHHAYLATVAERLFLFGGFVLADKGNWKASSDILELTAGRWQKVAQLPQPLTETVSFVLDGKVHLLSGRSPKGEANASWGDQQDQSVHWVFNPADFSISVQPALPLRFNSAASVTHDGAGYLLGGRQMGAANLSGFRRYLASPASWQSLPDLPQAQAGHAAVAWQNGIWSIGGEYFDANGGGVYAGVWRFDLQKQQWQQAGVQATARHGLGAVVLNNELYLIGGATQAGLNATSAVVEKLSTE